LRQIAPKWLDFTKRVRKFANTDPETFFNESFHTTETDPYKLSVSHKQARWHTEMYGYIFAAAQVGVTHRIRRDVMLYPGYEPYLGRAPFIMHYGSDYTLGKAYFNKMMHQELRLESCKGFLFDDPGVEIATLGKKDALSLEHLATLNAAFCGFYRRIGCESIPARCATFDQVLADLQPIIRACTDDDEGCRAWAQSGECERNPKFMHSHCGVSCNSCDRPIDSLDAAEAHYGDWKYALEVARKKKAAEGGALAEALSYIAESPSVGEDELEQLEEAIAARRLEMSQKAEL